MTNQNTLLGRACRAELDRIEDLDEPTPDELAVHEFLQQTAIEIAKRATLL